MASRIFSFHVVCTSARGEERTTRHGRQPRYLRILASDEKTATAVTNTSMRSERKKSLASQPQNAPTIIPKTSMPLTDRQLKRRQLRQETAMKISFLRTYACSYFPAYKVGDVRAELGRAAFKISRGNLRRNKRPCL